MEGIFHHCEKELHIQFELAWGISELLIDLGERTVALAGIVAGVGARSDQASAPMVRAHSSCAPSFLSSIWNRARLAPLNKFAR